MEKDKLFFQRKHLDILVRNEGFQFTDTFFPYTSGQIGPYYIQSIAIEKNGVDYETACVDMAELVKKRVGSENIDVISGGESRDWDFSNTVAFILRLPHAKIYKDGRILGATELNGKRVAHVADLNNEGSSPRDLWVPAIKKAGGKIHDIFFYVDRMEDGVQVMKDLGLRSHSLVQLGENAWDYLLEIGAIDKGVYDSLRERIENKNSWARNMLKSKGGIETLANLLLEKRDKIIKTYSLE